MNDMNMENIMEQIENIKNNLNKIQKELESTKVTAEDEKGIVTAIVNGLGEIIDYEFNSDSLEVIEIGKLKKAFVQASNAALEKAKKVEKDRKKQLVGNVNIPDIPGLF